MLARYRMARGVPAAQLPEGIRQDTRDKYPDLDVRMPPLEDG